MLLASNSDIIKIYIQQTTNEGQILNDGRFLMHKIQELLVCFR
jgi:hypothetical protein